MPAITRFEARWARASACVLLGWLAAPGFPSAAEPPAPTVQERLEEVVRLRKDTKLDQSISLARALLVDVERDLGPDSREAASVMVELSGTLGAAGKAGEPGTIALAERAVAIERTGADARGLTGSLMNLGLLLWRRGDYPRSRSILEECIDVGSRELGADDLLVAKAIENLGILFWTTGEYDRGLDLVERTLAIRRARLPPEDDLIGRSLNNIAVFQYKMGDYPSARQSYEQSLEIRLKTLGREHPDTADVIDNLALVLEGQGDYREAREMYEEALGIRERTLGPTHPQVARSLHNVGDTLRLTGDLEGALEFMQRSLALNEAGGEPPRVADSLQATARVLLDMGRYDEARRDAERALDLRERITPGNERIAGLLALIADIDAAQGRLEEALGLRRRAVEVIERAVGPDHPDMADHLGGLADVQIALGDLEAAAVNLNLALAILETQAGPDHPDVARTLGAIAAVRWRQGRLDDARAAARRAGAIQDAALRSSIQDLPETQALHLAAQSVEPEVVLFSGLVQSGSAAADWLGPCWEWTLRRRGLVFDELARRQRTALTSASPGLAAVWERLAEARRRLAALWIRGPGDDPAKYKALLAAATEAKKAAEKDLGRSTADAGTGAPPGPDEVQRALPAGAALVEVVRVDVSAPGSGERERQDLALLLFAGGRTDFVRLGGSSRIDRLVEDWRRALEADMDRIAGGDGAPGALAASRRAGLALRRAVWDPIAAKLGKASEVFLVPDGALHRADLRALPLDDGRYLVEASRPIHLLSTGRDLVRFAEEGSRPAGDAGGMLALGAPDFGAPPDRRVVAAARYRDVPAACAGLVSRQWVSLPDSGLEVKDIAALAPPAVRVRVATGEAASEELFRRDAPKMERLHLATHGFFASADCAAALEARTRREIGLDSRASGIPGGNPLLLSGLVLAGAGREDDERSEDGVLTAEEIAGLDLTGVRLAVLSACDTGQGSIAVGEGVFGLRRAFEMAGVPTVVMSLWRVPDREARRWMKSFYTRLFDGATVEAASRAASLDALHRLRGRHRPAHPYFWAGFVPAGDWR